MSTCKDCKWWVDGSHYYRAPEDKKVCDYDPWNTSLPDNIEIYAEAADDTGMEAAIFTSPDFGCVNFTEKRV